MDNGLDLVLERILKENPREDIVHRLYMKNSAVYINDKFPLGLENVNLYKLFPNAELGEYVYVWFCVSAQKRSKAIIKISSHVDVFIENEILYKGKTGAYSSEYSLLEIDVDRKMTDIKIKCPVTLNGFGFEYLISCPDYTFMWAKDYRLHIRHTVPLEQYKNEEGFAVSKIYKENIELKNAEYIFPPSPGERRKKDFNEIYKHGRGCVGYAYTIANQTGEIEIINCSPIKVFINNREMSRKETSGKILLNVRKNDTIVIKSIKAADEWGFECDDDMFVTPVASSNRKIGDKWILMAGFGSKDSDAIDFEYEPEKVQNLSKVYCNEHGERMVWRLQDGSYIRAEMDSCFFGQWYYAVMVGLYGILRAAKYFGNKEYERYFIDNMGIMADCYERARYDMLQAKIMPAMLQRAVNLDCLDPIGTIGMNIADAYMLTGENRFLTMIYSLREALYDKVPRDAEGVINRLSTMWSDDLYMSIPFIVRLGKIFADKRYYDDAHYLIKKYFERMYISEKQIFSHIFFMEEKQKSFVAWGRGNGWVMWALAEFLDNVPEDYIGYRQIQELFSDMAKGICRYQDETGMWHQVLDRKETYLETSCTAMFLYALLRGKANGSLNLDVNENIKKAYTALVEKCIDDEGNIYGVCKGSGCSKDYQMYSKLEMIRNDEHGSGIVICALIEYLKLQGGNMRK